MVLQWFQVWKDEFEGSHSTITPGIEWLKIRFEQVIRFEDDRTTSQQEKKQTLLKKEKALCCQCANWSGDSSLERAPWEQTKIPRNQSNLKPAVVQLEVCRKSLSCLQGLHLWYGNEWEWFKFKPPIFPQMACFFCHLATPTTVKITRLHFCQLEARWTLAHFPKQLTSSGRKKTVLTGLDKK